MNKPPDGEEQSKRQGPETTYSKWQRDGGIPIYKNYWVDLYALELGPWERKGCLGAFVNLSGQESLDAYVAEIPPGKESKPERHMFEKGIYILSGQGSTTVWYDGMPKHTFEWQEGSLFSPPLNCWHQHFNGRGDAPVRYLAVRRRRWLSIFFIAKNSFTKILSRFATAIGRRKSTSQTPASWNRYSSRTPNHRTKKAVHGGCRERTLFLMLATSSI